ncbi:hypothetical protein TYRP_014974 [Tyrophagus putrescentiae]|nr:hypothetical protein TYRP_014974 [Tyrophagus putrescentiae]
MYRKRPCTSKEDDKEAAAASDTDPVAQARRARHQNGNHHRNSPHHVSYHPYSRRLEPFGSDV